jgi:uncharacterized membrane protein
MSQLLLAVYRGEETAEHVLGVLRAQDAAFADNLESLAVVSVRRDATFTVITEPSRSTTSFWGVFWEALFGLTFGVSERVPATGSSVGRLFRTMERAGFDVHFRARIRRTLRRGSSALGLVAGDLLTEALIAQPYLRPRASVRARLLPNQDMELLRELGWFVPSAERGIFGEATRESPYRGGVVLGG